MIGFGILDGDWEKAQAKAKIINMIEPVVEGSMQFFFQSTILYITVGPGETYFQDRPMDISSILFTKDTASLVVFVGFFSSSFLSTWISFARLLTMGNHPVVKQIVSWQFMKIILMMMTKVILQSYMMSMAIKNLMYKFVSKVYRLNKIGMKILQVLPQV